MSATSEKPIRKVVSGNEPSGVRDLNDMQCFHLPVDDGKKQRIYPCLNTQKNRE